MLDLLTKLEGTRFVYLYKTNFVKSITSEHDLQNKWQQAGDTDGGVPGFLSAQQTKEGDMP